MKNCISFFLIAIVLWVFQSCIKDKTVEGGSSLTIINSVVGSNALVTNFSESAGSVGYYANTARRINYGSYSTDYEFGSFSGVTALKLYHIPDTMQHSPPFYNLTLDLPFGRVHSLFLTGTISTPDTLFTTDNPPYHPATDSSVGIRFINLSPGSNPVNVTLSTSTAINEFASIGYKKVTAFKNYPTIASVSSYSFQIRDVVTNAVIATQTLSGINNGTGSNTSTNQYRFRNITILLIGQSGGIGAAAQKALVVNNY